MATMRTSVDVIKFGGIVNREKCVSFSKVICLYVSQECGGRAELIFLFEFRNNK
jgi:hypothetical protein